MCHWEQSRAPTPYKCSILKLHSWSTLPVIDTPNITQGDPTSRINPAVLEKTMFLWALWSYPSLWCQRKEGGVVCAWMQFNKFTCFSNQEKEGFLHKMSHISSVRPAQIIINRYWNLKLFYSGHMRAHTDLKYVDLAVNRNLCI